MESAVGFLLCLVAASLSAISIVRVRRLRAVEARTDAICGARKDDVDPLIELGMMAPVWRVLRKVGLVSQHQRQSLFLIVYPLVIVVSWAVVGWKFALIIGGAVLLLRVLLRRRRERKNAREFTERLPAILERVRQLIITGKTLQQAFLEVFLAADPALQRNVRPVIRRMQHGAPLAECIDLLARQIGTVELFMLAAFVRTNTKFGGKISETLVNLINQLTSRSRLEREIQAGTAETRTSAIILLGLTVLVIGFIGSSNETYMNYFLESESGRIMLIVIVAWPLIGLVVMKRVLRLDI